MNIVRHAALALGLAACCGSAHAFSAKGNYNVTFNVDGGGQVQFCVNLASAGASGPYRDVGYATFYASGSPIAGGTYVVFQKTIAVVVTDNNGEYISASGSFQGGSAFNTAVIDFENDATILGTASFDYIRNGGSCASGS